MQKALAFPFYFWIHNYQIYSVLCKNKMSYLGKKWDTLYGAAVQYRSWGFENRRLLREIAIAHRRIAMISQKRV